MKAATWSPFEFCVPTVWQRKSWFIFSAVENPLWAAKFAGDNASPYALAQFLAIRDQFADHWQPQGGIESA